MIPIGIQEQGGSEELDERVTAIENQEDMENVFVAMQNFSFQDNILTIYSGWIWKLLGVNYSNPANVSFPIAYCAAGKSRFEYIVPNDENGFTRITGQETLGTAQAPQLPAHGLYVTFFLVTDSAIGIPKQPNIAKTPNIQEILDEGYSTTNIIWFYNNNNSNCLGISSERILFQKLESVFNQISADNTTESYNVQLPNKTGGAEETIAMASDLEGKEDKTNKGVANGYAPLNEFAKIASQYLNVVNDFVTGGETALASAETVKTLKNQINAINLLLSSDNVNLDNVQEIVDAIETVQTSLNTILVNDLTTGGTTKALTAEMGKILKGLIDALTTLVGNKVDKVEGERLINAAEITKLAGLGSIATTVKPILSTALATQNVAGFVTYINALNPVLVVGASEIVKYNLTDTGRVFELNLRGRSFGTGQPAIVAADVLEVTDFLNKDIKLSNYPSTRNDGQLPTNKVFAPDANGNVKLYSIAIAPAPYLEVLIPDSTLPSYTTNFTLKGAFFTPTMTVAIAGQTINYITFVSDNLVRVNVTTGAAEGLFAVTLNNGISITYNNALLIVLGTVLIPESLDYTIISGFPDLTVNGEIKRTQLGSNDIIELTSSSFQTPISGDFTISYQLQKCPFISNPNNVTGTLSLLENTTEKYKLQPLLRNSDGYVSINMFGNGAYENSNTLSFDGVNGLINEIFAIKRINNVYSFYVNNVVKRVAVYQHGSPSLKIRLELGQLDIKNIKLIIHP